MFTPFRVIYFQFVFVFIPFQTRLARGASLRVSIGDIADLLELSPREIEELRKFHNDPKPKEVRVARVEGGGVQQRSAASCRGGGAQRMDLCYF